MIGAWSVDSRRFAELGRAATTPGSLASGSGPVNLNEVRVARRRAGDRVEAGIVLKWPPQAGVSGVSAGLRESLGT